MNEDEAKRMEEAVERGVQRAMGHLWGIDINEPKDLRQKQKELDFLSHEYFMQDEKVKKEEAVKRNKMVLGVLFIATFIGNALVSVLEFKMTGG